MSQEQLFLIPTMGSASGGGAIPVVPVPLIFDDKAACWLFTRAPESDEYVAGYRGTECKETTWLVATEVQ